LPDNYKYKWLFERKEYSLGRFIDDQTEFYGHDIDEIYQALSQHDSLTAISKKCFQYVLENHSLDHVLSLIHSLKPQAQLKDVFRYTPNSWEIAQLLNLPFIRSFK
jgi:hypothetical protein